MADSTAVFEWKTHEQSTLSVAQWIANFAERNSFAGTLKLRMLNETGTRFFDWVDRIGVSVPTEFEPHGYLPVATDTETVWRHPLAMLPDVFQSDKDLLAIKVERVVDFLHAHGFDDRTTIVGNPGADVRRAIICDETDTQLQIVERHGSRAWNCDDTASVDKLTGVCESFRLRRRDFDADTDAFDHARRLIADAVKQIGTNRTCDLFFQAERDYWQNRNDAACVQRSRQDALGLGWANHDHHTYRSSRAGFAPLISCLELLGFECRERFYAGKDAGWGAQVLEQFECGVVIFADVDLSAEELAGDFAHEPLPIQSEPGTVGLWCALHGEAFLQAGMHHLECQFDFDASREQLTKLGVESMAPFTDFEHLRQAFTVGQRWPVPEKRLQAAIAAGYITDDEAQRFRTDHVIGSHMEILERNHGYKGFNKTGISEIILETNPKAN